MSERMNAVAPSAGRKRRERERESRGRNFVIPRAQTCTRTCLHSCLRTHCSRVPACECLLLTEIHAGRCSTHYVKRDIPVDKHTYDNISSSAFGSLLWGWFGWLVGWVFVWFVCAIGSQRDDILWSIFVCCFVCLLSKSPHAFPATSQKQQQQLVAATNAR